MSASEPLSQQVEHLQRIYLFRGLDPSTLMHVIQTAYFKRVARGSFFFLQDDAASFLYVLVRGQVKLTQVTPEGHQTVLGFIEPGRMFGCIAVLSAMSYPVSAEAMEDCEALAWDGERMARLMEIYPRLALNAIDLMAQHVRDLQDRLRELVTERVERRIARALLRLVRQLGRKVEGGILIDLALTRQDLAEMTGTTLYTVSRVLSRWEEQGLIASGRARVVVLRPHGLVTIAEDLPPDIPAEAPTAR
ncbi:MAG: Crp/Fnr family transcriptional regulator [Chloroflexi bacterium]|nr:Crp/Fnr family transcriptional regulator [Chloroflexota bacterium]